MQTGTERALEQAHEEGRVVIVFDHELFGRAEFVKGLREASETLLVRKATGLPLGAFLPSADDQSTMLGADTFAVLWWLARRRSTEPDLQFDEVLEYMDGAGSVLPDVTRITPDDEEAAEQTDPT